ncbi:hypothetical protein TrVE_jg9924 [Triparma verrucosa]|uniref:Uncharacterized protein n=1 Tax=Triparma verrucosa TaxID=1606542 RepID=A0A9W7CDI9_9STRA|nr:hypothetical protein TrVE_jg9924 [Triparma verrucosa]
MSSRSRRTAKPSSALLSYFSQLDGLISPDADEVPLEPDRSRDRKVGNGSNPGAKGNKGGPKNKNPAKRKEKVAPPLWDNSTGEDLLKFDAPEKFDYLIRYKGLSKWWPAMIINDRGGGLVDVEYCSGEVEFTLNRSSFKKRFPYKPEPDNKVPSEDESEVDDGKTFLTLKWDDSEEANPLPIEGDIVKLVVKKKREKEKKKKKVGPGRKKGSKNGASSKATSATVKKDFEQNSARSNKATTATVKRKVANVEVKAMKVTKTTPKKKKMRSSPRHEHGNDTLQSL